MQHNDKCMLYYVSYVASYVAGVDANAVNKPVYQNIESTWCCSLCISLSPLCCLFYLLFLPEFPKSSIASYLLFLIYSHAITYYSYIIL